MKISWNDIARKLTSRKFWVSLAGIVTGIALALGADANDIQTISGTILSLVSAVTYCISEAYVDGKNKTETVEVANVVPEEGAE